jgi:hypothetical protein
MSMTTPICTRYRQEKKAAGTVARCSIEGCNTPVQPSAPPGLDLVVRREGVRRRGNAHEEGGLLPTLLGALDASVY